MKPNQDDHIHIEGKRFSTFLKDTSKDSIKDIYSLKHQNIFLKRWLKSTFQAT